MQEIFKDIPGYKGKYQVSNMGRIKSLSRKIWIAKNKRYGIKKERLLKPLKKRTGYLFVCLYKNKKGKYKTIHRLVLRTFNGKSKLQCNHKNGIKIDNRLENLEYCTPSENLKHAIKIGLKDQKGEKNPHHKLTEKDILEIRKLYKTKNYPQRKLGTIYNVAHQTIGAIITRKNWAHI